ncbi:MAG: nucleotidyltransferase family protein [Candidatus Rokuibacteriota bacterium]
MIAAVVLAAGLARRMGRQKLLLALQGKAVVRWSVEAVLSHVDEVVVVTGHEAADVRSALADLPVRFVHNTRPEAGQGSSIAVGVAALTPTTEAVLIVLGDQPQVPPLVIPALLRAFRRGGAAIVTPLYRGIQGTPVVFGAKVFTELVVLTGDGGARTVVRAQPERVREVPFELPMPDDVDTPEDYARLL